MTYEEAFMTGSVAEGTIKGTFAEFFAQDGTKLFSFQRKNSAVEIEDGETQQIVNFDRTNADVLEYANSAVVLKDGTAVPMISFKDKFGYLIKTGPTSSVFIEANKAMAVRGVGDTFTLDVDFPVCRAYQSEAVKGKVPVTLLPDAIDWIKEYLLKKEKHFRVFASYTKYTNGKWLASYGEEITEQLYDGKTTPDMKLYYDGTPYVTTVIGDEVKFYQKGKAKFITDEMRNSTLFDHSLWCIGNEVIYAAQLKAKPKPYSKEEAKLAEIRTTFAKKYKKSELEAYEYLIDTPETRDILDNLMNPVTGKPMIPYIYVDINLSQDTVEVYQEKYKILEKNLKGTLYAKKGAFDWYPTNISNAMIEGDDGELLNLTDYLKQKKEALDKAKALIAAAGAATIL